ncbi:MAG: tetratricopeptide repeat protein [Planctomycetaceae bacterium]|nr:tetratricopeptide repeat protein [Planctomycetaceae bacterium]
MKTSATIIRVVGLVTALFAGAAIAADRSESVYRQAGHAIHQGDFDAAIRKLDEAIRLAPKEAKLRGLRGVAWIRKGDYDRGSADLKAAIVMNAGDAAAKCKPSTPAALSADALRHGKEQVAKMLKDRPAMAQYPQEAGPIRDWAARKFAGEDFGDLIDWDSSSPLHSDAEHLAAAGDAHAAILVEGNYTSGPNEGKPRSFEELWAGAVYELYNVGYSREYVRLNGEAEKGTISKEAFVGGILKSELSAAQRTRGFYVEIFLPWAAKKKLPTDSAMWFCDWWDTADHVLDSFTDRSTYPWNPYGRTYDWAAVHRYWHADDAKSAQKVLLGMKGEEGYEDEAADVFFWIGRCLARLNKPAEAVEAFSQAIHLDPESAATYRARGEQYQKLGDKAKADGDAAKAKELDR